jgi:hypothetical protein
MVFTFISSLNGDISASIYWLFCQGHHAIGGERCMSLGVAAHRRLDEDTQAVQSLLGPSALSLAR